MRLAVGVGGVFRSLPCGIVVVHSLSCDKDRYRELLGHVRVIVRSAEGNVWEALMLTEMLTRRS